MKKLIAIILIILTQIKLSAQDSFKLDNRNLMNFGKSFFYELHYLPTPYIDTINAIVLFKFSYDLMTFRKLESSFSENVFYSQPNVDIDFQDSEGIIRNRTIWKDTIKVFEFEKTLSKTDFINGFISVNLKKDKYKVTLRFSNTNVGFDRIIEIKDSILNDFYEKNVISKPIFTYQVEENSFIPHILKNNINFSIKNNKIIVPVSFNYNINKFWYRLKFVKSFSEGLTWESDFEKQDYVIPIKNQIPIFIKSESRILLNFKEIQKVNDKNFGYIIIDFPSENLVPGNYNLQITNTFDQDTTSFDFQVIWVEKPFILQKPRYAIESMYYILTDEEYKEMLNADYQDYSKLIIDYWKRQDPTPETPYNEAMAEYFKRVDFALFNFKTFSDKNGVKTDKGKVYILFGQPTSIEKKLKEDDTYEIWNYKHLNKKFIFQSKSNDSFKLIEIQEGVN